MLWWYVAALDVVQQKLGHYFAKYVADYCHFRYWNFCRKRSLLFLSRCQEKDSLKLVEHLVTVQILYQELSIFVYANMFVDSIEEGLYAFLALWEILLTFFLLSVSQIIQWKVCFAGMAFLRSLVQSHACESLLTGMAFLYPLVLFHDVGKKLLWLEPYGMYRFFFSFLSMFLIREGLELAHSRPS